MKRELLLLSAICVFLAVVEAVAQSANSSTLTILHSFAGGTDGGYPQAGLIQDASGNLYGTTGGGPYADGTIFQIGPDGDEAVLFDFAGPERRLKPQRSFTQRWSWRLVRHNLFGRCGRLWDGFQARCVRRRKCPVRLYWIGWWGSSTGRTCLFRRRPLWHGSPGREPFLHGTRMRNSV